MCIRQLDSNSRRLIGTDAFQLGLSDLSYDIDHESACEVAIVGNPT